MSFEFTKKLPTPSEIKEQFPVPSHLIKLKSERDAMISDVFTGKSDKFLVIVGPCSADNEPALLDYVERLSKVQEKIKDKVIIIPRVYTNKPRTTGEGYKGMLHQPDPTKAPDMLNGLLSIRQMHINAMNVSGLTSADEMLYPDNYLYLSDILSYVAVGARSVENQQHRLTASGMDVPCGMKNPTSGDLSVMMNSVIAAQINHTFLYRNHEVNTTGNPLCHTILRGSQNMYGQCIPNYHFEDIMMLNELYEKHSNLVNPACIIDTNHSNSNKRFKEQIRICKDILHSRNYSTVAKKLVKGVMIESYIEEGNQKIESACQIYGKSITDPCLGWNDTEKLLLDIAELV